MELQRLSLRCHYSGLQLPAEACSENAATVEWTINCCLPPDVCNKELASGIHRWQSAQHSAFICESHHSKSFSNDFHVKCLCNEAWFMRSWATFRDLGALLEEVSEKKLKLVMDADKQSLELSFASWAKCNTMDVATRSLNEGETNSKGSVVTGLVRVRFSACQKLMRRSCVRMHACSVILLSTTDQK